MLKSNRMRGWSCLLGLITGMGLANGIQAGPPVEKGTSVVVIYNSRLPESKDIAFHYAERRQVPTNQVLGLELPTGEVMTRADYNGQLFTPLAKWLQESRLISFPPGSGPIDAPNKKWMVRDARIRYAVLCYGVPLKIAEDTTLIEAEAAKLDEGVRRNGASVDSELALLPQGWGRTLAGPTMSPFYSATNPAVLNPVQGLLMVTRLDGPSPAIARALVDKAMEAETNGLWGRGYFDARGLATNNPLIKGDEWIRAAAEYTRRFGYQIVLDTNEATFPVAFPMSQIAFYAGWYDGIVSGPFTRPNVEFMPGAFAYHLHSFSALTIRSTTNAWVGPLLAAGATATMGCVEEPFLDGTPDMAIFFNRWLAPGYSFGEAAYASIMTLSWQVTIVGDPLYRPFSIPPQNLHRDLTIRQSKLLEWSHARVIGLNLYRDTLVQEMLDYLNNLPETKRSAVLSELLGDLDLRNRDIPAAITAYQQALKNNPTPQQKVRLVLTLTDKLQTSGRQVEAFDILDRFYKETPDYPDQLSLCEKLEPLASKIKKSDDAKKYRAEIKRLEKLAREKTKK